MPSDLAAEGTRVRLRALEPVDVDTLYDWENDPSLWNVGSTMAPFSRKQLWDYIDTYDGDIYRARQLRLMIDIVATGETIGTLDLFDFDPANSRCSVGIFVTPGHQGEGYASEALRLIANSMRNIISLHQLTAVVAVDNHASRALFKSCGFHCVATLPQWLCRGAEFKDAELYSLILK
ncbi:MAG: GNAT family N-acetyltransferase [Muribaculaceae bacterium]|nr:GNAT family N-acetyltransferase [Muribaculaceae bacterium]